MTTEKQICANQQNAQKSTGPKSIEGKHKVSANRITHGILSSKLLLAGEDAQDYQSLHDDLQAQLRPVGALELGLVEKIAVVLWRQRRLVGAETAAIELEITPKRIASEVTTGMGLSGFGSDKIEPEELPPFGQELADQLDWCKAMIEEYNQARSLTLDKLSEAAPLMYSQLAQDAEADQETIEEYLAQTNLDEYIGELIRWCHTEARKLETKRKRYPAVAALSEQVKAKIAIPWQKLDVLSKYQTTLDNQLYKAMKGLRDEQSWRMSLLDTIEPAASSEAAEMGLNSQTQL